MAAVALSEPRHPATGSSTNEALTRERLALRRHDSQAVTRSLESASVRTLRKRLIKTLRSRSDHF